MFDGADQCVRSVELVVKLIVQVSSIDLYHESGIAELGVPAEQSDEEHHGERLARSGRVPDHAQALVAAVAEGVERSPHRLVNGEELVVLRALLGDLVASNLEEDEAADVGEQSILAEQACREGLHGPRRARLDVVAIDALPWGVPLLACGPHAVERGDAVGNYRQSVELEELRDVISVVGDLVDRLPHRRPLAVRILQLEHDEG